VSSGGGWLHALGLSQDRQESAPALSPYLCALLGGNLGCVPIGAAEPLALLLSPCSMGLSALRSGSHRTNTKARDRDDLFEHGVCRSAGL